MTDPCNRTTAGPWHALYDWKTGKWRAWKMDGSRAGSSPSASYDEVKREVELRNMVEKV